MAMTVIDRRLSAKVIVTDIAVGAVAAIPTDTLVASSSQVVARPVFTTWIAGTVT